MMSKDITKFLGKVSREEDILAQFKKMVGKAKSIADIRKAEHRLLKPKPIPPYHGPKTGRTSFKQRGLLLVFKNKTFIDRFAKFVKINKYNTNNTYHVELFVELIRILESGRLEFNYKENRFYVKARNGARIRL
jgi:hypothetical protein